MTLVTRTLSNVGDPLCAPDGTVLANKRVTFTLVTAAGTPTDAFDATTGERVVGVVTVDTDALGEFTVGLWPNSRGDKVTQYRCHVNYTGVRDFIASVDAGATTLTWLAFKAAGDAVTAAGLTSVGLHIADTSSAHAASAISIAPITGVVGSDVQAALEHLSTHTGGDPTWGVITGALADQTDLQTALNAKEATANKDASGGYAGLTLFKLNLKNALGTITSFFTTAATVARTWTLPDKDGTVAMLDDVTGLLGTANTWTAAQVHSDQSVSRAMFIDCANVYVDKGNSGTATQTLDYTAGSHQKITATGNFTVAASNWPPTGNTGAILLEAVNFGAFTVTFPAGWLWVKPDGTTTTSVSTWLAASTGRTAFQTAGTDFLKLVTRDAGTTVYVGWAL